MRRSCDTQPPTRTGIFPGWDNQQGGRVRGQQAMLKGQQACAGGPGTSRPTHWGCLAPCSTQGVMHTTHAAYLATYPSVVSKLSLAASVTSVLPFSSLAWQVAEAFRHIHGCKNRRDVECAHSWCKHEGATITAAILDAAEVMKGHPTQWRGSWDTAHMLQAPLACEANEQSEWS